MKRSDTENAMVAAASMAKPMKRGDVTDLIAFRKIKLGIKWTEIAKSYLNVHRQHRSAWTWEVEMRPWVEKF